MGEKLNLGGKALRVMLITEETWEMLKYRGKEVIGIINLDLQFVFTGLLVREKPALKKKTHNTRVFLALQMVTFLQSVLAAMYTHEKSRLDVFRSSCWVKTRKG